MESNCQVSGLCDGIKGVLPTKVGLGGGRRQIRWFRRKRSELYSGHVELETSVRYEVDVFKGGWVYKPGA